MIHLQWVRPASDTFCSEAVSMISCLLGATFSVCPIISLLGHPVGGNIGEVVVINQKNYSLKLEGMQVNLFFHDYKVRTIHGPD